MFWVCSGTNKFKINRDVVRAATLGALFSTISSELTGQRRFGIFSYFWSYVFSLLLKHFNASSWRVTHEYLDAQ